GEYRMKQDNWVDIRFRAPQYQFQGRYTGDAAADLLLGLPQQVGGGNFMFAHSRQQIFSGYVQDDWKITHTLTLNLGVRYDYTTPFYGVGDFTNVNFDF